MQSRKAFTLLETVISLAIVCSLAAISIYNLKDYQARADEKQAIIWFKNTFKNTFNYCYLNDKGALILLDPKENTIEFSPTAGSGMKHQIRKLPTTLKLGSNSHLRYTIYGSGQGGSMSLKFLSTLTHKTYTYKIQMGWGEIIESET